LVDLESELIGTEDKQVAVSLKRIIPKLNTMYYFPNIECRISFNIIDFMFTYLVKENGVNKEQYYKRLRKVIGVGETNYRNIINGDRIEVVKDFGVGEKSKISKRIMERNINLELEGVSLRTWKKYFAIERKIKELEKDSQNEELCKKAKAIRTRYRKSFLKKIENREMNVEAHRIYRILKKDLFEADYMEEIRIKVEALNKLLDNTGEGILEVLFENEPKTFNVLGKNLSDKIKIMNNIKKR